MSKIKILALSLAVIPFALAVLGSAHGCGGAGVNSFQGGNTNDDGGDDDGNDDGGGTGGGGGSGGGTGGGGGNGGGGGTGGGGGGTGGGGTGAALQFSINSAIVETGAIKASTLTKVELLDTSGALLKTATLANGTATFDLAGLSAGNYFLRVNDLAADLVPTRIDNATATTVQTVGPKLRTTLVGPSGSPVYRLVTFSKGQSAAGVMKYSNGTATTPATYAYGMLYLQTSPQRIEMRALGSAALLSTESSSGPHPFSTWMLSGGSGKTHGDPANYQSDGSCSCHGNLDSKQTQYTGISRSNGWCYKCHYGKAGSTKGFVDPAQ